MWSSLKSGYSSIIAAMSPPQCDSAQDRSVSPGRSFLPGRARRDRVSVSRRIGDTANGEFAKWVLARRLRRNVRPVHNDQCRHNSERHDERVKLLRWFRWGRGLRLPRPGVFTRECRCGFFFRILVLNNDSTRHGCSRDAHHKCRWLVQHRRRP